MTTHQTVKTLNASQIAYLRAAIHCLLAAQAQAASRLAFTSDFEYGRYRICADMRDDALGLATNHGTVPPLGHQDGAELADLLAVCALELRMPDAAAQAGITPYFDEAPGSYTDQVGADEEAWKVPVTLTVVAETAEVAAAEAREFLARSVGDDECNYDETVLAYEVGYEAAFVPGTPAAGEVLHQLG